MHDERAGPRQIAGTAFGIQISEDFAEKEQTELERYNRVLKNARIVHRKKMKNLKSARRDAVDQVFDWLDNPNFKRPVGNGEFALDSSEIEQLGCRASQFIKRHDTWVGPAHPVDKFLNIIAEGKGDNWREAMQQCKLNMNLIQKVTRKIKYKS